MSARKIPDTLVALTAATMVAAGAVAAAGGMAAGGSPAAPVLAAGESDKPPNHDDWD